MNRSLELSSVRMMLSSANVPAEVYFLPEGDTLVVNLGSGGQFGIHQTPAIYGRDKSVCAHCQGLQTLREKVSDLIQDLTGRSLVGSRLKLLFQDGYCKTCKIYWPIHEGHKCEVNAKNGV